MPLTAGPLGSLGARLAFVTVAFCVLGALLSGTVRAWSAWHTNVESMSGELTLLEQVNQHTLSKAIWEVDRDLLKTHVASAAKVAGVGRVELTIAAANGATETFTQTRAGWQPSSLAPSRHLALIYEPFPGGAEKVGELELDGDERVLWSQLRGEVIAIAAAQSIQFVLLAAVIMLMFSRMVTVHVQRIARHLAQLTPDNLSAPLALARSREHKDELTMLVGGVNQLQSSLSEYLAQKRAYEDELAGHRDRLAGLVAERTVELQTLNMQLEAISRSDALTGLPNRRHFDAVKDDEFRRALRTGQPLSVLLGDIDYFKRYNDHYGHAMGDQCLRDVAQAMQGVVSRAGDLLARIGGEEFAMLLPATDEAAAHAVAEKLRKSVTKLRVAHAASDVAPYVTLSIGLACLQTSDASSFDELLELADQALYAAKSNGRNQVASHEAARAAHGAAVSAPVEVDA